MPTRSFTINPAQFSADMVRLSAAGCTVEESESVAPLFMGEVNYSGYIMSYKYDGTTLTITAIDKPFFSVPWSVVFDRIAEHLQ